MPSARGSHALSCAWLEIESDVHTRFMQPCNARGRDLHRSPRLLAAAALLCPAPCIRRVCRWYAYYCTFLAPSAVAICRYMQSGIATIETAPKSACESKIARKSPDLAIPDAQGFHTADVAKPAASKMFVKSAVDDLPPICATARCARDSLV